MTAIALWFPNPSCCKALLSLAFNADWPAILAGRRALNIAVISVDNIQAHHDFRPASPTSQISSPRQRYSAPGDFGVPAVLISTSLSNTTTRCPSRKGTVLVGIIPRSIPRRL